MVIVREDEMKPLNVSLVINALKISGENSRWNISISSPQVKILDDKITLDFSYAEYNATEESYSNNYKKVIYNMSVFQLKESIIDIYYRAFDVYNNKIDEFTQLDTFIINGDKPIFVFCKFANNNLIIKVMDENGEYTIFTIKSSLVKSLIKKIHTIIIPELMRYSGVCTKVFNGRDKVMMS